jgi:hypothetical protein
MSPFPPVSSPPFLASASTTLLIFHCCAIDSSVLVSQYSTRPDGNHAIITVMITGMKANIFACIGSGGAGLSLNWPYIATPIRIGRMKYGSMDERSWIQPMKGACRISTLSSSTQ